MSSEVADLGDDGAACQRPLAESAYNRFQQAIDRCDLESEQQVTKEQLAGRFGLSRAAPRPLPQGGVSGMDITGRDGALRWVLSESLTDRLGFHERQQVVGTARFGPGSAQLDTSERMHTHHRACALPVEIEVADFEFLPRLLQMCTVS